MGGGQSGVRAWLNGVDVTGRQGEARGARGPPPTLPPPTPAGAAASDHVPSLNHFPALLLPTKSDITVIRYIIFTVLILLRI